MKNNKRVKSVNAQCKTWYLIIMKRVKFGISSVVFLLFFSCLSSVQAEQWSYHFEIMKGKKYPLCRDYVANIKNYIKIQPETTPYDLSCIIYVTPKYLMLFRLPGWQLIEPSKYHYWFLEIAKMRSKNKDKPFDQKLFNAFMTEWEHGPSQRDYAMWMADVDIDFDGHVEKILRVDAGGNCLNPKLGLLNKRNIYKGRFGRNLHILTKDKKHVKPYSDRTKTRPVTPGENVDYIIYKGRTFKAYWYGTFEKSGFSGMTSDLYYEKAGEPTEALIKLYEPYRYENNTYDFPDDDSIININVCDIKIKFKKED